MSFKEIRQKPFTPFEEVPVDAQQNATPSPKAPSRFPNIPKLPILHLNLDIAENLQNVKFLMIRGVIAFALICFGATSTGSAYGPMSGRFSGDLLTIFYVWQFGNLIAMMGLIVAYDTVRRYV